MNPAIKKFYQLIFSDKNKNNAAKKIFKLVKNNPDLLEQQLKYNISFLHILLINHKVSLIEKLMEENEFFNFAHEKDSLGNSLLHYAVNYSTSEEFRHILRLCPYLVNEQNDLGNTPLHEAILNKKTETLMCLMEEVSLNPFLKNKEGKSALDLAMVDPEMIRVFFKDDFSKMDKLHLDKRVNSRFLERGILKTKFPRFFELPSRLEKSKNLLSIFRSISKISLLNLIKRDPPEETYDFITIIQGLKKAFENNYESNLWADQLKRYCKSHYLSLEILTDEVLEAIQNSAFFHVILENVQSLVIKKQRKFSAKQVSLIKELEMKIFIEIKTSELICPDIQVLDFDTDKKLLAQSLWQITLGFNEEKNERSYDFEKIIHQVLGLQTRFSLDEILETFVAIHLTLDREQKLLAGFMVSYFVYYNQPDFNRSENSLYLLELFKQTFLEDLDPKTEYIKEVVEKLLINQTNFRNEIVVKNFNFLKQHKESHIKILQGDSFTTLIHAAINATGTEKANQVQAVSQELRALTYSIINDLTVDEFQDFNWQSEDKFKTSPNIAKAQLFFDKLSRYFESLVLNASPSNIKKVITFLLDLAKASCQLVGENEPDLTQLMIISSVFNKTSVSRLTTFYAQLKPKSTALLAELNELVAVKNNNKWRREIWNSYRSALPFLGSCLSDMIFAREGNDNLLDEAEQTGRILLDLLKFKQNSQFNFCHCKTNLPEFLENYEMEDTEKLYHRSLRLQPKQTDLIDLTREVEPLATLNAIEEQFLTHSILPSIKCLDQKTYTPDYFVFRLMEHYAQIIKSPLLTIDDFKKQEIILNKLEEIIQRSVHIYNHEYFEKKLSLKVFHQTMNELKEELTKNKTSIPALSKSKVTIKVGQTMEAKSQKLFTIKQFSHLKHVKPNDEKSLVTQTKVSKTRYSDSLEFFKKINLLDKLEKDKMIRTLGKTNTINPDEELRPRGKTF